MFQIKLAVLFAVATGIGFSENLRSMIQRQLEPLQRMSHEMDIRASGYDSTAAVDSNVDSPVLTGAEDLDIKYFRDYLKDRHPLEPYTTAQAVREASNMAYGTGSGIAGRLLFREGARSILVANWTNATILGRREDANKLRSEIRKLTTEETSGNSLLNQVITAMSNHDELAAFGSFFGSDEPHSAGAFLAAHYVNEVQARLTDSADPEGYLRQRLQATRDRLMVLGDLFLSYGH